jgi:hypothetical protein
MARAKSRWIQGAKLKKGAFTRKAKAAGKSVQAYANQVLKKGSKFTTKTKRQASLAKTFKRMAK